MTTETDSFTEAVARRLESRRQAEQEQSRKAAMSTAQILAEEIQGRQSADIPLNGAAVLRAALAGLGR